MGQGYGPSLIEGDITNISQKKLDTTIYGHCINTKYPGHYYIWS